MLIDNSNVPATCDKGMSGVSDRSNFYSI